MLVGFDGTVGGLGSLAGATGTVLADRMRRIWGALNEPIPFRDLSGDRMVPGMGLLGRTVGAAGSAAQAVGQQFDKVRQGATYGSIGATEYEDAAVQASLRLLASYGFVAQLCGNYRRYRSPRTVYLAGPTTLGSQDPEIVARGVDAVLSSRQDGEELIVVGYSRGGLNAINACDAIIRRSQRTIDLLILFDPVDRDSALGSCDLSAAVRNCILVQRAGNWITWRPYMAAVQVMGTTITYPDVWLNNSRWWFGRMVDEDSETLTRGRPIHKDIDATHAAFGGVPWTGDNPKYMSESTDRANAETIAAFVNRSVFQTMGWDPGLALIQPVIG